MAKKQTLKASTSALKSEPPSHHFYASSLAEWRVSYDLGKLIADMHNSGYPFNVFLVGGPIDRQYEIRMFAPDVEDKTFLVFYGKE